jgi:hypothetical protein
MEFQMGSLNFKKCTHNSTYYRELRRGVKEHGYDKERKKPSLQKLIEKVDL